MAITRSKVNITKWLLIENQLHTHTVKVKQSSRCVIIDMWLSIEKFHIIEGDS